MYSQLLTNTKNKVMKKVEITIQEIWMATRPSIRKSKKNYTRKDKHKKRDRQ